MNIQEQVLQYIKENYKAMSLQDESGGLSAKEISEALGLWPNDVSLALNALVKSNALIRKGSRPIRYTLSKEPPVKEYAPKTIPFERIIGYKGSLKLQIDMAKAGASYPPYGTHMLILGQSGVGKSLLVEEIANYINYIRPSGSKERPFIVFNCADYADNPQLLLSQLFGYERGAFTGADSEHKGLVDAAKNGILFIDEIHRLPSVGQEMLFTLMDKGLYRKLGGVQDQHANLMIIGATTENPDVTFLQTFKRRIPMIIELPTLEERPIKEKIDLVYHFVYQEALRLKIPLKISEQAFSLLVSYRSNANIGSLRNEIQLCCARSYFTYKNNLPGKPYVELTADNLTRELQSVKISNETKQYIDTYLKQNSLIVTPTKADNPEKSEANIMDIYSFVEEQVLSENGNKISVETLRQNISNQLKNNIIEYAISTNGYSDAERKMRILDKVTFGTMAAANELVRTASLEFNHPYSEFVSNIIALYLQQIKYLAKSNQASSSEYLDKLRNILSRQISFCQKMRPLLEKTLNIQLTDNEITILSLLLSTNEESNKCNIGYIIMGHGSSTASSIAEFINYILSTSIAHAIDIPIELPPEQILDELCENIIKVNKGHGVIVLTDTDNIEYYEKKTIEKTGVNCRVIPALNTMLALELCKEILTTDKSIDEIIQYSVSSYYQYLTLSLERRGLINRKASLPAASKHKNVILVCCVTGMGCARQIREWLIQFPAIYLNTEIITIGINENIQEYAQKFKDNLKLVISFINPNISGVPFISIEDATSQEGVNRIALILRGWCNNFIETHWSENDLPLHVRFERIGQKIDYFAPNVDKQIALEQAGYVVTIINTISPIKLPSDLQVRIYIHTLCMFERLTAEKALSVPDDFEKFVDKDSDLFKQITMILSNACNKMNLILQLSEVYYFILVLPEDITNSILINSFSVSDK